MQLTGGQSFAWRVYVARRRKVRRQKFYLAAGIILLTVAALAWYLGFYIQRPAYALEQAAKALETHDMELFARRVDVASVCSFGYDDLTYMLFARDTNLKEEERSRAGKFYEEVKPAVTEGLRRSLESGVQDGTFALPTGVDMLKGRQLGIDYEYLLDYSCLRTTTLLSVQNTVRDGSGAMAVIAVREEETGLEFPLQLRMEKALRAGISSASSTTVPIWRRCRRRRAQILRATLRRRVPSLTATTGFFARCSATLAHGRRPAAPPIPHAIAQRLSGCSKRI